jgi:hypothetical protein
MKNLILALPHMAIPSNKFSGYSLCAIQVASLPIVELYVADFRLVWRCLINHLHNVFENTWTLVAMSPCVVVDAARAACFLDVVLNVRAPHLHPAFGPTG